ncbi:MAG: LysM peptidoglycan-binding domain-containing protein [Syntrophomonadaceae bacterium]|jgi:cell wall-associated NlpC family hydrolase
MRKIGGIIIVICLVISVGVSSVRAVGSQYTVQSGDTLWAIALNNGTTVNQLKQVNGLTSDLIHIGDRLVLPSSSSVGPVVAVNSPVPAAPAANGTYIVQSGDTLWQISLRYGTTVARLKELNNLTSDMLWVGQKLVVEGSSVLPATPTPSRSGDSVDGSRVVQKAAEYLGTRYVYGGQSSSGFDCSGFVYYIYQQFGYSLPRTAASQAQKGIAVTKDNLQPGDLVFFTYGGGSYINHVGIYSGNGQFIHSSSPSSGGVIYSSLNSGSYAKYYAGARRILR